MRTHRSFAGIVAALLFGTAVLPIAQASAISKTLPVSVPAPLPLHWQPCADVPTRDCATLTVPLDYTNPTAGMIDLPVARARAANASQRIGTLVYNPGGPGNSVADFIQYGNLTPTFSQTLVDRFDIVGFDPRGTTNGLSCQPSQQQEQYWESNHLPRTTDQVNTILNLERQYNQGCISNNQPLINHVDTASAVRDMESLRLAMGEQKFSYMGRSYGTFIGYRYMALYPGRLRAMVLDSVYDRSVPDQQSFMESNVVLDQSWQQFKAWCQQNSSCSLHGQNIDQIFDAALTRARTNPIPAPNGPLGTRPVNDWQLLLTVELTTAAGSATFAWTDQMVAGAQHGDASLSRFLYDIASGYAGDGEYYSGEGTHRSIACADTNWSQTLRTTADVQALAAASQAVAPRYGQVNVYQGPAQCVGFSVPPVEAPPVRSTTADKTPVLVVSATKDATTPLLWATRIAAQIPGAHLLVRDGDGHINYNKSSCIKQDVDAYLTNLTLPSHGTVCATDNNPPQPPPVLGTGEATPSKTE
ncbi:MAG TPA: alpha/beta hydrolase [Candidatus Saccharimonadales bacterium]|nr:alpha/beta hydrolase [Candidatus Saccharimonadales bacterium]